jgi:hypothetical protein
LTIFCSADSSRPDLRANYCEPNGARINPSFGVQYQKRATTDGCSWRKYPDARRAGNGCGIAVCCCDRGRDRIALSPDDIDRTGLAPVHDVQIDDVG